MRSATGSVLIVSSDAELGEGVCLALLRLGIMSDLAPDAVTAVQRMSQGSPRAIVIDLRFSDMDPQQLVRRAIVCPEMQGLPIVAIGGAPEDREQWLDSGCTAILHRDMTPLAVADVLSQLVRTGFDGEGGTGLRLRI